MACQFGGRTIKEENGQQVTITNASDMKSFWNAFLPGGSGSDEVTSDFKNAEGNQLGSWVMRVDYDAKDWSLGVYADHFFEDHSAMFHLSANDYGTGDAWQQKQSNRFFLYDLKDIMLGTELNLKHNDWLRTIVLEYVYTKYQSGPLYHDHTPLNSGHVCGMDNYYNHHLYTGWQHWGQVIGNPLYRSPIYNKDADISVKNNRFVAWHLGLSGNPSSSLSYRLLATYLTGYGTYNEPMIPKQYMGSVLAECSYRLRNSWKVSCGLGFDSGKLLGNNWGVQLTITKTGIL